ncbi:MAG: N-acetylmuramoyl-L-alanine amidase [Clostridiales bacterium]|nr:N-acetylmuramoyl-L-alanine amidase [Clostridiales bacterium]
MCVNGLILTSNGIDGGAEGDFANESELNLKYSLTLKEKLEQYGFRVVLTRKDMAGLYSPLASNKKRSEMEKRKKIIEKAKPAFVISVHMNSFSSANVRGAQVFYANGSVGGQALAESVQTRLNQNLDYAKVTAKVGDYYILNCTDNPSILIECGFLSNPEEEQLLMREDYRNKFCYNVLCGLLSYYAFD